MKAVIWWATLLLAGGATSAAQQAQPGYRVSGVVVDAVTGTPVPRAEVSTTLDDEEIKTTAGDDGKFVFQDMAAGKYAIYAVAQGYVREGLNEHRGFLTGVAVGTGLDSEHIFFPLHRQAVIAGRVTDEHGEAVRHAQVLLLGVENLSGRPGMGMHGETQSDDLGEYRFARLLPGEYCIAVDAHPWYARPMFNYATEPDERDSPFRQITPKPNPALDVVYPLTFYPGVTNERAAAELKLTAGDTVQANIQLQALPSVHVRMSNLPVDGKNAVNVAAAVKFFGPSERGVSMSYRQISPGEYELAGLPPGDVTLHLRRNGNLGWQYETIAANLNDGDTLDAAETAGVANVSGRVIPMKDSANHAGGSVVLLDDGSPIASAILQKDGTFSFAPVQVGTYKIMVNVPGNDDYVQSVSAKGAKTSGKEITIASAGDVQLSITMGRGVGEVTGVAKLDGKPTAGVMVLLVPESGQAEEENSRMDQSDSDGSFALRGIFPGKYRLVAIEDGWDLEWGSRELMKEYLEKGEALQIFANDQKKVVLEVQRKK